MEKMPMREELALTLLAAQVASEVEETEHSQIPEDLREEMRDRILRSGQDIVEMVRDEAERCDMDLEKYLPVQLIDKMADDFLKASDGKLTLADLYEEDERAAHRFVLGALGHGVNADDERATAEWLESKGVDLDKLHRLHHEGPYEQAWEFVKDWLEAYPKAAESAVQAASNEEAEFIQYLEQQLIPDLQESGSVETAKDFIAMVAFLKHQDAEGWDDLADFIEYLEDTLIPDLEESGLTNTAEDFEAGIALLAEQQSAVHSAREGDDVVFVKDIKEFGIKSGDKFKVEPSEKALELLLYGDSDKVVQMPEKKMEEMEDAGLVLEASAPMLAKVLATGEPDQDYNHALFDSIVTALGLQGLGGQHREFDKYQGIYLDVTREGRQMDRFWLVEMEEFKGPGGEEAWSLVFSPESMADVVVQVLAMKVGDAYRADVDDLVQYLRAPRGKGNELQASKGGKGQ